MATVRRLVLFVSAFLLGFGVTAAWAGWDKEGKQSTDTSVDGSSANVRGDNFGSIRSHTCVLYSVSVQDGINKRQVEAGIVRCSGTYSDGSPYTFSSCGARGVTYVETWLADNTATCGVGGSFTDGTAYYGAVVRNSDSSDTFTGSIGSASHHLGSFHISSDVYARSFGEVTAGTQCPGDNPVGHFGYFSRFNYGQGWDEITTPMSYSPGGGFGPCWSIEDSGSNGGYYVD